MGGGKDGRHEDRIGREVVITQKLLIPLDYQGDLLGDGLLDGSSAGSPFAPPATSRRAGGLLRLYERTTLSADEVRRGS
jgi:hypothetical protein